jgi:hypothetical protein
MNDALSIAETVTGNEQQASIGSEQPQNSESTKARVKRFMNSLRQQDCGRLDVWIGGSWVRGLVFLANHEKRPLWEVVQDAVKSHITRIGLVYRDPPEDRSR